MASTPVVFVGTYRVPDGGEEEYRQANKEMTDFVEQNEPRVIAWGSYTDESAGEATTVQVHPDSASLAYHMQVAAARIGHGIQMVEVLRVELYGDVEPALVERMRAMLPGRPVIARRPLHGFSRG